MVNPLECLNLLHMLEPKKWNVFFRARKFVRLFKKVKAGLVPPKKRIGQKTSYLIISNRSPSNRVKSVVICHRTKCIQYKVYHHVLQILSRNSWAFWAISGQFNECDHFSKFSKLTAISKLKYYYAYIGSMDGIYLSTFSCVFLYGQIVGKRTSPKDPMGYRNSTRKCPHGRGYIHLEPHQSLGFYVC